MIEQYISNEEYKTYYEKLGGLRSKIISVLPIKSNMRIVDIGTGYAYFAVEAAKRDSSLRIVGIDCSLPGIYKAQKHTQQLGLSDRISIVAMNATRMGIPEKVFDMAINFLGLEDIHMTCGKRGVQETILEVNRILKPYGHFCFVVMPVDEMETEAQKLEVALYSFICNARWLKRREYIRMIEQAGFILLQERRYRTGRKLTPKQAQYEISYACENVPKIYGIKTPSIQKVWEIFGKEIEEYGVGHVSKIIVMIAQKVRALIKGGEQ